MHKRWFPYKKKICACPLEQDSAVNCFLIDENVNKLKYRIQYLLAGQLKKKDQPDIIDIGTGFTIVH